MELTFSNGVAEFVANSHFCLHTEGGQGLLLYQRTSGGEWDILKRLTGDVTDIDIPVTVSKDYKITCTKTPSMAVVIFSKNDNEG